MSFMVFGRVRLRAAP